MHLGEQRANLVIYPSKMPRRPDLSEYNTPLTKVQVASLRRHLSGLDPYRVERFYSDAHERCRLHGALLPKDSAIQEMVIAWKVLKQHRRQGPPGRG